MAVYNIQGEIISSSANKNHVFISDIKQNNPLYTDDQILSEAIIEAQSIGETAKIIWDGTPIYFSGQTTHICNGFAGIDFNGSKIYMPNYDNGVILDIKPDETTDLSVPVSDIGYDSTTNIGLKDRVFCLGRSWDSDSGMSLGRHNGDGDQHYCAPTIVTTPDGRYTTGKLYLHPTGSDPITCWNIHKMPEITFELCNAEIITYNGNAMSIFIRCSRSNSHLHNFKLTGTSGITAYHNGIFDLRFCSNLELDNIYGVNPVQWSLASGYFCVLTQVSNLYVHDINVGDDSSWGAFGSGNVTNVVLERCFVNRWDNHYGQYGYLAIKECVIGYITYGVGYGIMEIRNTTFTNHRTSSNYTPLVEARNEHVGIYDGDIIIDGCTIDFGAQPATGGCILYEQFNLQKASDNMVYNVKGRKRCVRNTVIPENIKCVFSIGTPFVSDADMFSGVTYSIEETHVQCSDALFLLTDNASISCALEVKGCSLETPYIEKSSNACNILIKNSVTSGNLRVKKTTGTVHVIGSDINNVVSDQTSGRLIIGDSHISSSQSTTMFSEYALYGNIASDMASVNKHSA